MITQEVGQSIERDGCFFKAQDPQKLRRGFESYAHLRLAAPAPKHPIVPKQFFDDLVATHEYRLQGLAEYGGKLVTLYPVNMAWVRGHVLAKPYGMRNSALGSLRQQILHDAQQAADKGLVETSVSKGTHPIQDHLALAYELGIHIPVEEQLRLLAQGETARGKLYQIALRKNHDNLGRSSSGHTIDLYGASLEAATQASALMEVRSALLDLKTSLRQLQGSKTTHPR